MLLGVGRQARGVQQFMRVDVVHHALVLRQIRVQFDGDGTRIKAQVPRPREVGRLGLEARQAEVHVVALRPAQGDALGDPRQEDALRRGRGGAQHRLGQRRRYLRCALHALRRTPCLMNASQARISRHGSLMSAAQVGGLRKHPFGRVDQLEDRYLGMVEAPSSNLGTSTIL